MKYVIQKKSDKVHVREHDRHLKDKVADVTEHNRNRPTSRGKSYNATVRIPVKDLDYPQSKKVFPFLSARGDIDGDAVPNKKDCRPFDVEEQHLGESPQARKSRLNKTIHEMEEDNYNQEIIDQYKRQLEELEMEKETRKMENEQLVGRQILNERMSSGFVPSERSVFD